MCVQNDKRHHIERVLHNVYTLATVQEALIAMVLNLINKLLARLRHSLEYRSRLEERGLTVSSSSLVIESTTCPQYDSRVTPGNCLLGQRADRRVLGMRLRL